VNCVRCEKPLVEGASLLCAGGAICNACQADADLQVVLLKGTRQYAWAAFGAAILSNVIGFFGLFAVAALFSSLRFNKDLRTKDPVHQEALKTLGVFPKVLVVFAVVSAVGNLGLLVRQLLGSAPA